MPIDECGGRETGPHGLEGKLVGGLLTGIHLWLGERLGITRYENCWNCRHGRAYAFKGDGLPCMGVVKCAAQEDDGTLAAICDPCEAVWCGLFEEKGD